MHSAACVASGRHHPTDLVRHVKLILSSCTLNHLVLAVVVLAMPLSFASAGREICKRCAQRQLLGAPQNHTRSATAGRVQASNMATRSLRYKDPIVMPARNKHTGTVIMLHGLGDSGEGWAPVGQQFTADLPDVKFVFPHAPLVIDCEYPSVWQASHWAPGNNRP